MPYDKNATPKYYCSVNITASFVAASISSAKRQASNAMNRSVYPVDVMQVYDYESGIQAMTLAGRYFHYTGEQCNHLIGIELLNNL